MARTTVEDCFKKLNNKFELSILASYRAKQISKGAATPVDKRNDKNAVIALREIASEHVDIPTLKRSYIQSLQLCLPSDDVIEDDKKQLEENASEDELKESSSLSDELIENEFISVDEEDQSSDISGLEVNSVEEDTSKEDDSKKN
ncbi:MAG: DNA-directed RNA polymerase subunit omega [Rickettsiales bacterium]|nr:DNA-directed RNA polymerase subunit omega [Rickettsiales bacterium]